MGRHQLPFPLGISIGQRQFQRVAFQKNSQARDFAQIGGRHVADKEAPLGRSIDKTFTAQTVKRLTQRRETGGIALLEGV